MELKDKISLVDREIETLNNLALSYIKTLESGFLLPEDQTRMRVMLDTTHDQVFALRDVKIKLLEKLVNEEPSDAPQQKQKPLNKTKK